MHHANGNYLARIGIIGYKCSQELDGIFNYHHRFVFETPDSQGYDRQELSQRQNLVHNESINKVIRKP